MSGKINKRASTSHISANANNVIASYNVSAGLVTDSDVGKTGGATIERVITDGCVKGARRNVKHGVITERVIFAAIYIRLERVTAMGVVEVREAESARVIVKKRKCADGIVVAGDRVQDKRISSNGSIL